MLDPLKRKITKRILRHEKVARIHKESTLPKVVLQKKHVANCQLLLNRDELLERLPKSDVVAELGVDTADFSRRILEINKPEVLHLVDKWVGVRYHEGKYHRVCWRFEKEIESGQIVMHRKLSIEAADDFADGSLGWVYIDTSHSYKVTRDELLAYSKKVKPGGIIAGHDYSPGNWIETFRYGVIESVHEFCVKYDWELIYLTVDPLEMQSFAIRKIS
jgi:hypothetical protein